VTPVRSRKYLQFVREHACVFCATQYDIHAHHHGSKRGGGGMGLKPCDLRAVPLCAKHHSEWHTRAAVAPFDAEHTRLALDEAIIQLLREALILGFRL
jgi:hypothetical protein